MHVLRERRAHDDTPGTCLTEPKWTRVVVQISPIGTKSKRSRTTTSVCVVYEPVKSNTTYISTIDAKRSDMERKSRNNGYGAAADDDVDVVVVVRSSIVGQHVSSLIYGSLRKMMISSSRYTQVK